MIAKMGDLVRVVSAPNPFVGMTGIVVGSYIEKEDDLTSCHVKPQLVIEIAELGDLGGDTYEFYHNSFEVLSAAR
tara:strand:- start:124 stop:348 length:225 start_codon:yes stop_codon:yes gene_type:complete